MRFRERRSILARGAAPPNERATAVFLAVATAIHVVLLFGFLIRSKPPREIAMPPGGPLTRARLVRLSPLRSFPAERFGPALAGAANSTDINALADRLLGAKHPTRRRRRAPSRRWRSATRRARRSPSNRSAGPPGRTARARASPRRGRWSRRRRPTWCRAGGPRIPPAAPTSGPMVTSASRTISPRFGTRSASGGFHRRE